MSEPIEDLFSRYRGKTGYETIQDEALQPETPQGVGETFDRGFGAGVEGIRTDTDYFKGLFNTVIGDEEAAAKNIADARQREERTAGQFGELETFGEFIENPSFDGFVSQVAKNVGQVTPYLGTTITGGLGGAAVTGLAKVGLTTGGKQVTKRLVKDAFEKKLKGEAMPEEERVLAVAYRLAQRNNPGNKLTLKGGALAGMFGQEYSSMAGSNFGENLDYLDQDEAALRAAGLAIPQALIGIKGEQLLTKMLMKDLGAIAAKRSTKDGSAFSEFAKTLGKNTVRGGATEGLAEVAQEGLGVANRFNIDDEYTKQDAALRIGESAFAGFFGGAGISGAGSVATGSLRGAGNIMGKAKDFIEQARQQQVDNQIDAEQYGTDSMGYTTPEPRSSVNAQLRAALDTSTNRHSVWVEGPTPEYDASPDSTKKVDIQGETFYTRFIPGRGTIITKNFDIAEEVAKSQANESSLAEALQYSSVKPNDSDIAIEALDRGGNVVWQQATNEEGVPGAMTAAGKQVPEGGSIRRISIKEALENRKKLFESEQGPQVRNIDEESFAEMGAPVELNIGRQETYKPRDPEQLFDTTREARDEFAAEFAELDQEELGLDGYTAPSFGEGSPFATMSDAFMRAAVQAKRDAGDNSVFFKLNDDKSWSLMQTKSPEANLYGLDTRSDLEIDPEIDAEIDREAEAAGATTERLDNRSSSPITFIKSAISKAKGSRYARQKKVKGQWVDKTKEEIVTVDGAAVNLTDLVKEGQRLFSIEQKTNFTEGGPQTAQRNGLFQAIGSLIEQGYEIRIGGYDIRSKDLKDISELSNLIAREEADIATAALEFDIDPDDPNLSGRLAEYEQALSQIDETAAQTNSPLDRLKRERKAWTKKYIEYQKAKDRGDTSVEFPEKTPLLALMDVEAGTASGANVTLGKLLNITPAEPAPRDATYKLTNEDGFVVFEGNKQQVQERIESDGQPYRITKNGEVLGVDENGVEAFAEERNVGFNERNEDPVDQGPVADRGKEETRPIGFSEDTESANPDYTFDPDQENVGDLAQIGLKEGTIGKRVADIARRTLRLNNPVSVISIKELLAQDSSAYFDNENVASYVKQIAEDLRDNPQGGGRYIGFGDAHIILVDPDAGKNELDTAIVVAHELGHALFKEQLSSTLQNPSLYNRLFDAYQIARDADDAPAAYKGKRGFEEWYADQTANWAIGEYTKNRKKGLIGSHFQKVARALKSFYNAFSKEMKQRFGQDTYSPEFRGYMDEVMKTRKAGDVRSGARNATMEQKVIVRKMAEVIEKQQPGFTNAIAKKAQEIIRSDGFTPVYNFIITADTRLRKIGGNKLADLFYGRYQQSKGQGRNKLGFLKTAMLEGNARFSQLEDMVDGKLDSPEVQESIRIAFTSTPTRDLTDANAIAVRQWFDKFYDEYIEPSNTDVGRQRDYAPVVLKLSAIDQDPAGLVALLMEADPEAKESDIRSAVQRLVNYQQVVMDEGPISIEETNPAQSAEKAIQLTKKVKREKLQEAGFLEDPDIALMRYISNMVKRVEWNRNTKDDFGNSIYEEELRKLDPKARAEAEKIVHKYLGYQDAPLSPMWRAINSWGSILQIFAILPLAVLGSIPELAGPVIVSKEFGSVTTGMKEIVNTIRNRDEARMLARDLGVVTSQSVANVMMSQAELDYMSETSRKVADGFFRWTLLDTYTKFTREFASNMGVRFLENHSNSETAGAFSKRYLQELGVTAEEVQVWSKSNQDFSTPEGKKVRMALQRFVESSTLRPNSAERPLWASDPRYALVWQLKGFVFSYGKVMLAGAKRESLARLEGASAKDVNTYAAMTGAAGVFALMGIATMPLAMVGMELREYAKFGLAWAIPGIDHEAKNYFRTDDMSWGTYAKAAADRSFAAGFVTIGSQAMQAADWGRGVTGAAAVVLGPTAETLQRMSTDGFSSTFENRILPTGLL